MKGNNIGMKTFYHYTGDHNIAKILESNHIWFSHILDYKKGSNFEMFLEPYYFEAVEKIKKKYPNNPFYSELPDQYMNIYSKGQIVDLIDIVFEKSTLIEGKEEMEVGYVMPFDIKCYILCFSEDKENSFLRSYYSLGSKKLLEIDTDKLIAQCKAHITKIIQDKINLEDKRYEIKIGGYTKKHETQRLYFTW